MKRPELNTKISLENFQNFYWLKTELISFCRANGISTTGGKIEIVRRIEHYLTTGKVIQTSLKPVPTSSFDWKDAALNLNTKLTDNYKNTENVRAFMTMHIGPHFKFNTEFMNWSKVNAGKSLADAIQEWNRIYDLKRNKDIKKIIPPQFEYNIFIRNFFTDYPGMSLKEAIKCWKIKKTHK